MANSVTIRTTAPGAKDAAKDVKGLGDAFKKMGQDGLGADQKMKALGAGMTATGQKMTMGVTLPLLAAGGAAIKLAIDAEETEAKLNAAFTSMGASSWTSMEKLRLKAEELMSRTTFDDEAIKEAQAVLLTFGDVTGDAFDEGTLAALNMSTALNMDLQSATVMIGKALNDPVKGITAMTRAGIQFTDEQKSMIRTLVETGDKAGAQTIILAELEKQFGGMAEAVAETSGGQMKQALNELSEVGEDVGKILLPIVRDAAGHIRNLADMFQNLSPEVKTAIITFAGLAAALGPVLVIGGKLVGMFSGAAGLIAKVVQMTVATTADTTATTANTAAKNLNAKALLGVGAGAAAVGAGLVLINEGLNESNRQGQEAVDILDGMTSSQRDAAASTEVFGLKVGNIADGFATYTQTLFGWHSVADTAADAANALNNRVSEFNGQLPNLSRGLTQSAADMLKLGDAGTQAGIDLTDNFAGQIRRGGRDVTAEARALGQGVTDDLVGNLRDGKGRVADTMEDLMWAIKHPMAATRRVAEIEGALMGDALGDGLRSKNPYIRTVAEQTREALLDQLRELKGDAYVEAFTTGRRVGEGIENGYKPPTLPGPYIGPPRGPGADAVREGWGSGGGGGRNGGGGGGGGRNNGGGGGGGGGDGSHRSGGGRTPPIVVHLSTREVTNTQRHYSTIQGTSGGFR